MPGIFGFYSFGQGRENWNATRFIYFGLNALQGRGQESSSIAIFDKKNGSFRLFNREGLVDELFSQEDVKSFKGYLGIGQISPIQGDYIVEVEDPVKLVLAGDGRPNLHEDKIIAFQLFAERLSKEMLSTERGIKAATNTTESISGGYSFIALTEREEMICGRDRYGVKPLEIGSVGFDLGVVGSESAALDVIGATHAGSIKPGEIVYFDPLSIERESVKASKHSFCAFEYVYLARADSSCNDVSVYKVRERIGQMLAKESPVEADVVIGVPETAIPFAVSYSQESGIPARLGFIRTGRHTRSAIKPNQIERLTGVQLKLNPIRHSVDDRNVILIDDSVVRGNTLKNTVFNLKRRGAKQVHVRIGSPAIVSRCPYGIEIPPRDELIGNSMAKKEIADIIGADTFSYLSIEGLIDAIGLPKDRLCLGCFTGEYMEDSI